MGRSRKKRRREPVLLGWRDVLALVEAVKKAEEIKPSQQAKRDVFKKFGILGKRKDPPLTAIFYRIMARQGILDIVVREVTGVKNVLLLDPHLRAALRVFTELETFSRNSIKYENPHEVRRRISAYLSTRSHPYVGMWFWDVSWELRKHKPKPRNREEELMFKYMLPLWYVKRISELLGMQEAEEYFKALNRKPKISVRVNTLRASVDDVVNALEKEGIKVEVSRVVPTVLRFEGPYNFDASDLFKDGKIVIQEEAAALAPHILNPKPGEFVVDLAAAPGGKTELMGELMQNEGVIHAFDIDKRRIRRMKELLKRTGVRNVVIHVEDARKAPAILGKCVADKVLVDAPCTSDGTIMKNPDLRWRLMESEVPKFAQLQYEMLKAALKLVKPGGLILYTTCSALKEEDEDVIERLLKKEGSKLELVELRGPYEPGFLKGTMRAWPHKHPTIGFFYALLRRVK